MTTMEEQTYLQVPAQKKRRYRMDELSVTRLKRHRHENGTKCWAKGETKVYKHTSSGTHVEKEGGWGLVVRISLPAPCG
tara:strand:+ start:2023 stop:2259 length:237 start_codon:yes stop_codon:yes gene_type:complete